MWIFVETHNYCFTVWQLKLLEERYCWRKRNLDYDLMREHDWLEAIKFDAIRLLPTSHAGSSSDWFRNIARDQVNTVSRQMMTQYYCAQYVFWGGDSYANEYTVPSFRIIKISEATKNNCTLWKMKENFYLCFLSAYILQDLMFKQILLNYLYVEWIFLLK